MENQNYNNDEDRVKALIAYNLLDTLPERSFDRLTELASSICGTPIALISLIDSTRQWFKSKIGLDVNETSRNIAFCNYAISSNSMLEVQDATKDNRFSNNPLVLNDPHIRFYAGKPLIDPNGYALGTLCVIDKVPRKLSSTQIRSLELLSEEVMDHIIARKNSLIIKTNEASYQSLFENTSDLIHILDSEGNLVKTNSSWKRVMEYSDEEIKNLKIFDLIHEDYMEHCSQVFEKILSNKIDRIDKISYDLKSKFGKRISVECSMIIEKDNEKVKFIKSILRDISDHKKAEKILEEERKRLKYIIDGTNVGTWEWNVQTGETRFNERWANIIGYSLKDISPVSIETWMKFAYEDDLEKSKEALQKHFNGETEFYNIECRMKHKDGHLVWVLDRGKVLSWTEDGKPLWMYGTHQDITEIKDLEEELLVNVKKFKTIYDLSPVGIALNDYETGQFLEANEALLKSTQYSKEELLNLHYWFLTPIEYEPQEALQLKYLDENGFYGPYEKEYIKKDGTRYPVLLNGISYIDEDGKKIILSIVQDISKQKEYENTLRVAKEEALSASRAKSEFLANMSHEIRTPLNGVIGFTDLLMKTPMTEIQKQYMSTVYQSANSLLDLINDILDFSKIEAGKLELDINKTDLIELGNQVGDISKYQAHKKSLELIINISHLVPRFIWVDEVRLRQILVNLLNNAVKFTEKGEVELKVEILEKKSNGNDLFRFSVRDTGIGVAKENMKKILQAFSQEDTSITRKFGGTGLGLAITNNLLALMNSELKIESTLGKGSIFYFDVEFNSEYGEPQVLKKDYDIKKALIIDDNETNRNLLTEILKISNIPSEQANDGLQALELISKGNFYDLILIDYNMPYLSGLDTIKKIREIDLINHTNTNIILLHSSNEDELIAKKSEDLNIKSRLIKPIRVEQIFNAISKLHSEFDSNDIDTKHSKNFENNHLRDIGSSSNDIAVLIVEDNPVNMMLVSSYFKNLYPSFKIIKAENGKDGLEIFKNNNLSMVITDIQMPISNGYELSENIRLLDNNIPIIALTAGTVKGEKEKCLESGMNDYISKPVIQDTLKHIVEKWLLKTNIT